MRERSRNGSKLFLTELMIAIFFFSVITAVCIQLFADAHVMSKRSRELTQAVNIASNVAEYYSVWNWEQDSWDEIFPEGKWSDDTWQIIYDEQWKPIEGEGSYMLEVVFGQEESLGVAHITLCDMTGNELYSLEVKRLCGE